MSEKIELKCLECDYIFRLKPLIGITIRECERCHLKQKINRDTLEQTIYKRYHRKPKTPNWDKGPGYCRWCGVGIFNKSGKLLGNRRWCSDKCIKTYMVQSDSGFSRRHIFERDKGICAGCNVNLVELKKELKEKAKEINKLEKGREISYKEYDEKMKEIFGKQWYWNQRDPVAAKWHLDHIVPLIDGGSHGEENQQILCLTCHKEKTKKEASARAKNRKLNK